MNPSWLFVIATAIAVFGILTVFKALMANVQSKLEEEQEIKGESLQKEQSKFFIKVIMVETIPILLIVVGFSQIGQPDIGDIQLFFPLIIIVAIFIYAVTNLFIVRKETINYGEPSQETKNFINTFLFIAIALLSSIPTISIVGIFLLTAS
ncbi:hypothetical protein [Litchfieldia alkalitelluris]|uniref:hypothetical protein n=1 Tax=Litchfieldia alkalitelluris TaxID=304268 RepID=UPI000998B50E|nr:hypothetical protein [Litchfieldia alkalitelluris]